MASQRSSPILVLVMAFSCVVIAVAIIHMLGIQYMLSKNKEQFSDSGYMISPNEMVVYQGLQIPMSQPNKVTFDDDPSLLTVDGSSTSDNPRSMFMMAFNKCSPSCCPSTYSCNGGCVCMTDKQKDFIGKRGNNSATRCAFKDNIEY